MQSDHPMPEEMHLCHRLVGEIDADKDTRCRRLIYGSSGAVQCYIKFLNCLGIGALRNASVVSLYDLASDLTCDLLTGRRNDVKMAKVARRLAVERAKAISEEMLTDAMFELELEEEHVFVEAMVELEGHNVWVRPSQTDSTRQLLRAHSI
jgi:hypothetical protein